jgi:hypothetical protein
MNEHVIMTRCEEWELDSGQNGVRELYDLLVGRTLCPT